MKPNGTRIVGGFHCKEPITIIAMTREGQAYSFSSESTPLADRKSIGKIIAHVEKQDEIVDLLRITSYNVCYTKLLRFLLKLKI